MKTRPEFDGWKRLLGGMTVLRYAGGLLSFVVAAVLVYQVVEVGRIVGPSLLGEGAGTTAIYVMHIGPVSLEGGQILVFECFVRLMAIAFVALGISLVDARHRGGGNQ